MVFYFLRKNPNGTIDCCTDESHSRQGVVATIHRWNTNYPDYKFIELPASCAKRAAKCKRLSSYMEFRWPYSWPASKE